MRHERVLLVVLAYIIGFNTAFIAFALNADKEDTSRTSYPNIAVARTAAPDTDDTKVEESHSFVHILEENDGLYALVREQKRAFSVKVSDKVTPQDGAHVAVPAYAVSLDGEYIHFCEQQSANTNICKHFVYVVKDHTAHRVMLEDVQYVSPVSTVVATWSVDGILHVDAQKSINAETPWRLASEAKSGIDAAPVSQ